MHTVLACICDIAQNSSAISYSLFDYLINRLLSGRAVYKYVIYTCDHTSRSGEIGKFTNRVEVAYYMLYTISLCPATESKNTHSS